MKVEKTPKKHPCFRSSSLRIRFVYETLRVPHLPTVDSASVRVNCGFKNAKKSQCEIKFHEIDQYCGRREGGGEAVTRTRPIAALRTAVLVMRRRQNTTTHEFGERWQ